MPNFEVLESIRIEAPLAKVASTVRDFRSWLKWSPWLMAEPDAKVTFAQDGSQYAWEGKIVGAGDMRVVRETLPNEIDYTLTFLKPWKSTADVRISFQEDGQETSVSWRMQSSLPFYMFWMTGMMATMISKDFRRGLLMLKDLVETGNVPSKLDFLGTQKVTGFHYHGLRTSCPIADIGERMQRDFCKFQHVITEGRVQPVGKPLAIWHKFDMRRGMTEYTLAFPTDSTTSIASSGFVSGQLPSCNAYTVNHVGPYRHLGNAWAAGMMRAQAKVFRSSKKIDPFEIYEGDPGTTDENELITHVYFPIK